MYKLISSESALKSSICSGNAAGIRLTPYFCFLWGPKLSWHAYYAKERLDQAIFEFLKWYCMSDCYCSLCAFAWMSWCDCLCLFVSLVLSVVCVCSDVCMYISVYMCLCVWCLGAGRQWESVLRDADRHTSGWGRGGRSSTTWQNTRTFLSVSTGYSILYSCSEIHPALMV